MGSNSHTPTAVASILLHSSRYCLQYFIATFMPIQIEKLSAVSVRIALLFLVWLWGGRGLLFAIPILGVVNVVCPHVGELQPLAELLRD